MADINQVITLGIGTPSSIPHFILFGLNPTPSTIVTIPSPEEFVNLLGIEGAYTEVLATSTGLVVLGLDGFTPDTRDTTNTTLNISGLTNASPDIRDR